MKIAPVPPDERRRLEILEETHLLDTLPEPEFDSFTRLAAFICDTPIALITLLDANRQWFKSRLGMTATETPRDYAFCAHAILQPDVFEVPDSSQDERFADNPLAVGEPHVRFYAGAPLVTPEGAALGTLCVIDTVPRKLSDKQREALQALSRQIIAQVQLRRTAAELRRTNAELTWAEEEARAATERLEDFLENATDLVQSAAPDGRIVYVNRAWREALGYEPEELAQMTVFDIIAPDSLDHCQRIFQRLMSGESAPQVRAVFQAKDGRRLAVEGSVNCRFEGGRPVLTRGVFRDVTERIQAEETLVRQAGELRSQARLLELAHDAILVRALDGTVSYFNRGAEAMYGWPREEVLGRKSHALLGTRFPLPVKEIEQELLARDRWSGELTQARRDGTPVVVSSRWALQRDAEGAPQRVLEISSDITQRKQAEDELRKVTSLQRAIVEGAAYILIACDGEGIIQMFNPAAERELGYSAAELVGRHTPVMFHDLKEVERRARQLTRELGEPVPVGFEAFVAKARRGVTDENEWTYVRKDGSRLPMLLAVTALRDEAGRVTGFLGIGHDITARKEVDRMKNEFISTVSHELRTPLTSIRGALGLLEGGITGELPEQAQEFVHIARENSDRLIRLVNDMLDLEKIESGKLELKLTRMEPSRLVAKALEGLAGLAAEAGVTLQSELQVNRRLEADEDRLVQVLTNLLSNAIKFSPQGSAVRVVVRNTPAGRIRFSVFDAGPGISPEQTKKLFHKFQQLDQSDRRQKGGTGLGLAISKAIVEQHAGTIGVESSPGQGSEFWFELPATVTTQALNLPSLGANGPLPILVVEDDPMVLRLLQLQLEAEGYRVLGAGSVTEAEQVLGELHPAALVLDVFLPDGNGLELLQRLRRREEYADLPVIVLSGGRPEDGGFGAPLLIDWLVKPFDEGRLRKALRRAVRRPGSPRVLVVEDDASFRTIVVAQLRALGVETLEASDGAEAVRMARDLHPDLIILDVSIPELNGFQVVEALRQERARATPLIVYSGRDLTAQDRHELSLGMTRYLTKARTNESEFIGAVREMLNGIMLQARARSGVQP